MLVKNKKLLLFLYTFLIVFLITNLSIYGSTLSIRSIPITTAKEGIFYIDNVEATNKYKTILTYSLNTCPAGMAINAITGVISWTPTKNQIGENEVIVNVSDKNDSVTQTYIIKVAEAHLVSIEVLPPSENLEIGKPMVITCVIAHYDNGKYVM